MFVSCACLLRAVQLLQDDGPSERAGHYVDVAQVRVWDVRALRPMHAYFSHAPATALDISQRGLLAISSGRRIQARG